MNRSGFRDLRVDGGRLEGDRYPFIEAVFGFEVACLPRRIAAQAGEEGEKTQGANIQLTAIIDGR